MKKIEDDDSCGGGHSKSDMNGVGACVQSQLSARYKHEVRTHCHTTLARLNHPRGGDCAPYTTSTNNNNTYLFSHKF